MINVIQPYRLFVEGWIFFLSLHKLVTENPDLMKQAFLDVHSKAITPEKFIGLISSPRPLDDNRGIVYDWFMEYLKGENKRKASLENIVQFCTGLKRVPPMGLKNPITIKCFFTSLPMAEACFCISQLPTIHTNKTIFFQG